MKKINLKEYLLIAAGSILFAGAINLFIIPYNLYSGGIVGTSQILRTLIIDNFNINVNYDLAGIINLMLNIPLMIMAYRKLSPSFVYKTIFSIIIQTLTFSLIPVFSKPLISEQFASILIGTLLSAYGAGLVLVQKSSAGGNDLTAMLVKRKFKEISIGNFNLYYNVVLFSVCAILFNVEIAIYSIFQTFLNSFIVDKVHLQNIEVSMMVFTRNPEVKKAILNEHIRGVTYWKGMGAYTDNEIEILVTIVSKYEVSAVKRHIKKLDPKSFVIISNQLSVDGGFEKRLI